MCCVSYDLYDYKASEIEGHVSFFYIHNPLSETIKCG